MASRGGPEGSSLEEGSECEAALGTMLHLQPALPLSLLSLPGMPAVWENTKCILTDFKADLQKICFFQVPCSVIANYFYVSSGDKFTKVCLPAENYLSSVLMFNGTLLRKCW